MPDHRQLVDGPFAYLSQAPLDTAPRGGLDAVDTLATIKRERIIYLFPVESQIFELMDHPGVPRRDRPIDMVFQNLALLPYLDVAENVAYGLKARGVSRRTTPGSR